ncbi:MAG: beta-lactamase family protein [Verrucomicrobia bacterium]|nr:beta-lactamase family protein [Verrucomicrobiota bacterium]
MTFKKFVLFLSIFLLIGFLLPTEGVKFSGAALVAKQGKVHLFAGYGYANREKKLENTPQTQFLIASITKVFTAVAILKLQEEGKIQESLPVAAYLPPSDPVWKGNPPSWLEEMTIHHLLTHSSGLPDHEKLPGYGAFDQQPHSSEEFLRFFAPYPLQFKPGTRYQYSGAGYDLLGFIIERVSGQSYSEYLERAFFKPLGMDATFAPHTSFLSKIRDDHPELAAGYDPQGPSRDINMSTMFAEASIVSTTADLYRWTQALFGGKVISPASLSNMLTPYFEVRGKIWMGEGIFIDLQDPMHPIYYHNGRTDGFESAWMYRPQKEITIILLSNESQGPTFDWALDLLEQEQRK